jgi:hypothetical protein
VDRCNFDALLFPKIFNSEGSAALDLTPISYKMSKSSFSLAADIPVVTALLERLGKTGEMLRLREVAPWTGL